MKQGMRLVKCELCGNDDFIFLFAGGDRQYFSPATFRLVQCKVCGLVCLNPRPEEMRQYYLEQNQQPGKDDFMFLEPDRIKKVLRLKKSGRLLDIGCGWGKFLFQMKRYGWQVFGNDTSRPRTEFAREKLRLENIYNSDFCFLSFSAGFFDVVTLWHSLEHLARPQETLRKVNQALKDDGVLIIESPNFSSLQSKLFKENYYQLDLPRHLYQFTPQTLEKLLRLSGFVIYKRDYLVNPRMNFISLKISLLRYLGIAAASDQENTKIPNLEASLRRSRIFWTAASWTLNMFCLVAGVFLSLLNCDDSLRLYCRKATT